MTRKLLVGVIGVLLCFNGFAFAQAPKYPTKPIRMIVGYAPGGGSDIMGRLIAPQITEAMGQPIIVENRAGAAQNVAAEFVARSPADGYTLFMSSAALGVNVSLYSKLNYDPVKDFAPGGGFCDQPESAAGASVISRQERRGIHRRRQEESRQIQLFLVRHGSTQHLSGEMLKLMINTDITHVPYKGTSPSMTALASGEVDFSFSNIPAAQPMLTSGKIRAIAITSAKRSALLPELPTMIEGGLPGFVTATWYGLLAPAGTPAQVINALNAVDREGREEGGFSRQVGATGRRSDCGIAGVFSARCFRMKSSAGSKVVKASKAKPE